MSRDHRKLRVFDDAHRLVLRIYRQTRHFPKDEWFGLRGQMRRAAVSIPTNIVEGNARRSTADYVRFLNTALGSACELKYLVALSAELGLASGDAWNDVVRGCDLVVRQLERLGQRMEEKLALERRSGSGP
jgi:four helix bundle protein